MTLRTLIVDDEPLAIERLQILCAEMPEVQLVGTATDGAQGLRLVAALSPDLLILDIAMPGLTGLEVARTLGEMERRPAVVFVTAFDQHAVAAFEVAATDYLLKPVSSARLAQAVARVAAAPAAAVSDWATEFWVPHRAEMLRVAADDIELIEAERDYMRLHVAGGRSHLVHQTIAALERRLDPAKFLRIHRSTIVRRDRIAKLGHDGLGTWSATLADGSTRRVGRSYQKAVKAMFGRA